MQATRLQRVFRVSMFAMLWLALGGASCDKKSAANPAEPGPGPAVPFEAPGGDKSAAAASAKAAEPSAPVAKPDLVASGAGAGDHVGQLLEKLPSPCGKAISLKKTLDSDPTCKQAPFARKFVERLAGSGELTDEQIGDFYRKRYGEHEPATFTVRDAPFIGTPNAPVVIVEFFDYACPHCKAAEPMLESVVAARPKDVVLYFKQFPLHKESVEAAKAAIAAGRQGKFKQMHASLFAHQGSQAREELFAYAKELGLDMAKFEKDWNDPASEARVKADKDEGVRAKLEGTPTLFVNGKMYVDVLAADSLNEWIDEETAVNR